MAPSTATSLEESPYTALASSSPRLLPISRSRTSWHEQKSPAARWRKCIYEEKMSCNALCPASDVTSSMNSLQHQDRQSSFYFAKTEKQTKQLQASNPFGDSQLRIKGILIRIPFSPNIENLGYLSDTRLTLWINRGIELTFFQRVHQTLRLVTWVFQMPPTIWDDWAPLPATIATTEMKGKIDQVSAYQKIVPIAWKIFGRCLYLSNILIFYLMCTK